MFHWNPKDSASISTSDNFGKPVILPPGSTYAPNGLLTPDEQECLELSAELFMKLAALPVLHGSDTPELQRDNHDIQNRILSRPVMRAMYGESTKKAKVDACPSRPGETHVWIGFPGVPITQMVQCQNCGKRAVGHV